MWVGCLPCSFCSCCWQWAFQRKQWWFLGIKCACKEKKKKNLRAICWAFIIALGSRKEIGRVLPVNKVLFTPSLKSTHVWPSYQSNACSLEVCWNLAASCLWRQGLPKAVEWERDFSPQNVPDLTPCVDWAHLRAGSEWANKSPTFCSMWITHSLIYFYLFSILKKCILDKILLIINLGYEQT